MGRKTRLLWQIYPSYLVITLIALSAVTWYTSRSLRAFYLDQTAANLEAKARLAIRQIRERSSLDGPEFPNALCVRLGEDAKARLTLVLPRGRVLCDSEKDPARMDDHSTRPEIREALAGQTGRSTRYSRTLEQRMMYIAVPVKDDGGRILGVLRTSIAAMEIESTLDAIHQKIAVAGLIVAVLAAALSMWISRRISLPLEEMKKGAERFARGEFDLKLPIPNSEEIAGLAEAMNMMARQLDDRIRTVIRQRNEYEAVLSSMVEGVLAVDANRKLLSMNKAAARLTGGSVVHSPGAGLDDAVQNEDLRALLETALDRQEPVEGEIVWDVGDEHYLQAHGAVLRDARGQSIGALVVLNDVTRLRRLERVRQDFVANVSHELKTPITSIKGFVETLLDGALRDPDTAERFLTIIAKQAERMNDIINDLLTLSRVEQEKEKEEIPFEHAPILPVLRAACQICEVKASQKEISLCLDAPEDLATVMNPHLLEQAVVNLIDNAIKYSGNDRSIHIRAGAEGREAVISVIDTGIGIRKKDVPRLFERFYRVDKSRSRKLGGTGLGLAIVKHIVQTHGGYTRVESEYGKGSTFFIHLPLP